MRAVLLAIPVLVAMVIGGALGAAPYAARGFGFWVFGFLPVAAIGYGCVAGWLGSRLTQLLQVAPSRLAAAVLVAGAGAGMVCVEYGQYRTLRIGLDGRAAEGDAGIAVCRVMSFAEYMRQVRLAGMTVETYSTDSTRSGKTRQHGALGASVYYGVQMVACMVAAGMMVRRSSEEAAYCEGCGRYRREVNRRELFLSLEPEAFALEMEAVERASRSDYYAVARVVKIIADSKGARGSSAKVVVRDLVCDSCQAATMDTSFVQWQCEKDGSGRWVVVPELSHRVESPAGGGGALEKSEEA